MALLCTASIAYKTLFNLTNTIRILIRLLEVANSRMSLSYLQKEEHVRGVGAATDERRHASRLWPWRRRRRPPGWGGASADRKVKYQQFFLSASACHTHTSVFFNRLNKYSVCVCFLYCTISGWPRFCQKTRAVFCSQ